jgi:hypothetical protein
MSLRGAWRPAYRQAGEAIFFSPQTIRLPRPFGARNDNFRGLKFT